MYSRILVPLDGSDLSKSILPFARAVATAFEIPIELMHVIDSDMIRAVADPEQGRHPDVVEKGLKGRSQEYLEKINDEVSPLATGEPSVVFGHPAAEIVRKASAMPDALIAMATRGVTGVKRWLLGSVAEKVLHAVGNPLLLVKPTEVLPSSTEVVFRRVLVPLDGSGLAEKALPHVALIAKRMDLEVELLRAYTLPVSAVVPAAYPPHAELVTGETIRKDVQSYLSAKVDECRQKHGLKKVSHAILQGDAASTIIDTAQQTSNNLIAMSTHGRSGIGRWVLGSVADRVVRYSGDPVLLIRPSAE